MPPQSKSKAKLIRSVDDIVTRRAHVYIIARAVCLLGHVPILTIIIEVVGIIIIILPPYLLDRIMGTLLVSSQFIRVK